MKNSSGDWKEWSQHVLAEIQRLNKNQENLNEKVEESNQVLIRNTSSLEEHMRRTEISETAIGDLSQRVTVIEKEKIEKEAVNKYRKEMLKTSGKWLAIISTGIAIIVACKAILINLLHML